MIEDYTYESLLRPLGQMLESLRIDCFSVKLDSEGFIIRDQTRNRAQLTPREKAFLAQLHISHTASLDKEDALRLAAGVFEWHLTPSDIGRLELQGRERRRTTEQAPDSHSVSQILRVVGSILDQKRGYLSCVSKDEQTVTIEYAIAGGKSATEEYSVPMLCDQWVRMYKRRTADHRTDAVIPA